MIVKSFVIRPGYISNLARECGPGVIAVVRLEKKLVTLFQSIIHQVVVEKKQGVEEMVALREYLDTVLTEDFDEKKVSFVEYVRDYLTNAMSLKVDEQGILAYVLSQCATLCGEALAAEVPGSEALDGRGLVVCREGGKASVFDWAETRKEIERRCSGKDSVIVAGGYARLSNGQVVSVGKGGANMMASLIASAVNASSIEFYVEGEGINGITSMTYDEAAHYCASSKAPFSSAALWPAKNAGIPIIVKSIQNPEFEGTRISSDTEERDGAVSGIIVDPEMTLVTLYGTGLSGTIGFSSSIFSALAKAGVNIRFISQTSSEYAISLAVKADDSKKVLDAINQIIADNPMLPLDDVVVVNREVGILTIYGSRMKNVPGVSGKVYSLLGGAGVNVIASAQGGEELSVSVVVAEEDIEKAHEALETLL